MDVHVNRLNKAKNLTITALTNVQEVVPLIKKILSHVGRDLYLLLPILKTPLHKNKTSACTQYCKHQTTQYCRVNIRF